MKEIKVVVARVPNSVETPGDLFVYDKDDKIIFSCKSMELPWLDNRNQISCIPTGNYICMKVVKSHIPYPHISIANVAGRLGICIHAGNFASGKQVQILGCILVGSSYADINNDKILDIVNSKITFDKLMAILPDHFNLTIK